MKRLNIIAFIFAVALSSLGGALASNSKPILAVSASDWNASNIIDDAVFYDNTAMSTSDIQTFLNSKNPSCDTQGTQPASEYGRSDLTHAQYAASVGWPGPPYICLRDYYQVPRNDQNINNLSTNVRPDGSISAAEIIKRASDTYGINPKTFLVLIQKESVGPLLTDTWPLPSQYRSVVGYACPDTAPCDPKYEGFYNQIMNAAYQFKYYKDHAYDKNQYGVFIYRHQPYNTVDLLFNPNSSCGSTQTRMDNYATTGLYNYTPYQPNAAALNNMYGTGDGCSAYGNRNFWRMFIDWFGTVRGTFQSLQQPRWMQIKTATQKVDPSTGHKTGDTLSVGQQIKFTTKIETGSGTCLRTQHDTSNNTRLCVPLTQLEELSIAYTQLTDTDKLKMTTLALFKQNLRTNKLDTEFPLQKNQQINFAAKTIIGGTTYYVTNHDRANNIESGIPASQLEVSALYETIAPKWYRLKNDRQKLNPLQQRGIDSTLPVNMIREYNSRTLVNGIWHYRTENDTAHSLDKALPETDLTEPYEAFQQPRWMKAARTVQKINPLTGEMLNSTINAGEVFYYDSKITTESGTSYFRTNNDTASSIPIGIKSEALEDAKFEAFKQPRWMTLTQDSQRVSPYTGEVLSTLPKGTQVKFTSKIEIEGVVHFRSEADTLAEIPAGIVSGSTSEIPYAPFIHPRNLRIITDTYKQIPSSGVNIDSLLKAGIVRKYTSKIEINGELYFRTENDSVYDLNKAIPATRLENI